MYKPIERFFLAFFTLFLMTIVLINFLGWSGAYVDILNGYDVIDMTISESKWGDGYYFTFTSFLNLVADAEGILNGQGTIISVGSLTKFIGLTINALTFDFPSMITSFVNAVKEGGLMIVNKDFAFDWQHIAVFLNFIGKFALVLLSLFVNLLTLCLVPVLMLTITVIWITFYLIAFLMIIMRAFAGYYNVPIMGESINIHMYDSISSVLSCIQPYLV